MPKDWEEMSITAADVGDAGEILASCCEQPKAALSPIIEARWKEGKLSPQDHLGVLSYLASNEAGARGVLRAVHQVQNLAPCSLGIFGSGFFAAALAHANTVQLAHDLYQGQKHEPPETLVHVPMSGDFSAFVGHFPDAAKIQYWESPDRPGAAGSIKPQKPFDIAVVLLPTLSAMSMAWEQSADDGYVIIRVRDQVDASLAEKIAGVPVDSADGLLVWPGRLRRQPVTFV
jgi:hypothetical protein